MSTTRSSRRSTSTRRYTTRVHKVQPTSLDELSTIVKELPPRYKLMALLAAWCAMRFGELATGAMLAELMGRLGHTTPGAAMRYPRAAADRDAEIARRLSALVDPRETDAGA